MTRASPESLPSTEPAPPSCLLARDLLQPHGTVSPGLIPARSEPLHQVGIQPPTSLPDPQFVRGSKCHCPVHGSPGFAVTNLQPGSLKQQECVLPPFRSQESGLKVSAGGSSCRRWGQIWAEPLPVPAAADRPWSPGQLDASLQPEPLWSRGFAL